MFQNNNSQTDIINDIQKISEKINEEVSKDNTNEDVVTKLMFEQMLKGLYLQNFPMN